VSAREPRQQNVDYAVRNRELFYERQALREGLDDVVSTLAAGDASSEERVRLRARRRRLERALNDKNEEIFEFNFGLVRSYVGKFSRRSSPEDRQDLEAAGRLGLANAIETYDPDRSSFAVWAFKPIKRQVLRAVRDLEHQVLQPGDFEKRKAVQDAVRELRGDDQMFEPSDEDVAMVSDLTLKQVRRIRNAPALTSWSAPVGDHDSDGELGDLLPDETQDVENEVLTAMSVSAVIRYGLPALDQREHHVITRRWGLDGEPRQRLASIGEAFGLSREAVRQIETKALSKLGHPIVYHRIVRSGR